MASHVVATFNVVTIISHRRHIFLFFLNSTERKNSLSLFRKWILHAWNTAEFTSHRLLGTVDKERNRVRGWTRRREREIRWEARDRRCRTLTEVEELDLTQCFSKLAVYWSANLRPVGKKICLILSKVTQVLLRIKYRPWHKYWWRCFPTVLRLTHESLLYQHLLRGCWHGMCRDVIAFP